MEKIQNKLSELVNSSGPFRGHLIFATYLKDVIEKLNIEIEGIGELNPGISTEIQPENFSEVVSKVTEIIDLFRPVKASIEYLNEFQSKNFQVLKDLNASNDLVTIAEHGNKWMSIYGELRQIGDNFEKHKNIYEDFFRKNIVFDKPYIVISTVAIIGGYGYGLKLVQSIAKKIEAVPDKIIAACNGLVSNDSSDFDFSDSLDLELEIFQKTVSLAVDLIKIEYSSRGDADNPPIDAKFGLNACETPGSAISWILSQDAFMLSELGQKILSMGLFPSAFIEDINEKSLDLVGDLSLVEDRGLVTVNHAILRRLIQVN